MPGFTTLSSHRRTSEEYKALYGKEVKIGEAPWAVSLAMKKRISDGSGSFRNGGNKFSENEFVQHGTGTLVSPWHIVTAAHLIGISEDPLPDCDTGNLREAYFVRDYKNFVAFVNVTCAVPEMCKGLHRKDMFKPLAIKSVSRLPLQLGLGVGFGFFLG